MYAVCVRAWAKHVTMSIAVVCVDILAPSEAMTPMLYNPACGFASGEPALKPEPAPCEHCA